MRRLLMNGSRHRHDGGTYKWTEDMCLCLEPLSVSKIAVD
jgi:hypothetical protein